LDIEKERGEIAVNVNGPVTQDLRSFIASEERRVSLMILNIRLGNEGQSSDDSPLLFTCAR
jgi:hypothetical protein